MHRDKENEHPTEDGPQAENAAGAENAADEESEKPPGGQENHQLEINIEKLPEANNEEQGTGEAGESSTSHTPSRTVTAADLAQIRAVLAAFDAEHSALLQQVAENKRRSLQLTAGNPASQATG